MIEIQNRIQEILTRVNEIKSRFNGSSASGTSFEEKMEEVQEKVLSDKIAGKIDESRYDDLIREKSVKYSIPESLIKSVIRQESAFNEKAVSPKGAKGLMQLMPETAELLGVENVFNPVQNLEGGVRYLKMMMERFNGDLVKALAAYNAGPEVVEKYNGVPEYSETKNYVKDVLNNLKIYDYD
ncbi:MAG: lytic transglycosylase domain-containing protein [bacterium]|nr:lytic transglycosylase domain-containing protein [bacterium]